jgi:hypothetical protein
VPQPLRSKPAAAVAMRARTAHGRAREEDIAELSGKLVRSPWVLDSCKDLIQASKKY